MTRRSMAVLLALLLHAPFARAADAPKPAPAGAPTKPPTGMPAMQRYWFGFLTRGPGYTPQRTAHGDSVQAAHLENIGRMFSAGALVCAGPFLDRTPMRGVFIFRGDSARAVALTANDQAIRERRLTLALRPWVGPAGISDAYRALQAREPGRPDSMVRYQFALLKKGPAAPASRDSLAAAQNAHFEHLMALLKAGTLQVAGPFADGGDPEGVLIFRADSAAVVKAMADDPLVRRGWLALEIHPWMTAFGILPDPVWEP